MQDQDEEKNEAAAGAEQPSSAMALPLQAKPPSPNPNMKWYIIHSYSGFERKVKESLESRVMAFRLQENNRQSADPDEVRSPRCAAARSIRPNACSIPAMC